MTGSWGRIDGRQVSGFPLRIAAEVADTVILSLLSNLLRATTFCEPGRCLPTASFSGEHPATGDCTDKQYRVGHRGKNFPSFRPAVEKAGCPPGSPVSVSRSLNSAQCSQGVLRDPGLWGGTPAGLCASRDYACLKGAGNCGKR